MCALAVLSKNKCGIKLIVSFPFEAEHNKGITLFLMRQCKYERLYTVSSTKRHDACWMFPFFLLSATCQLISVGRILTSKCRQQVEKDTRLCYTGWTGLKQWKMNNCGLRQGCYRRDAAWQWKSHAFWLSMLELGDAPSMVAYFFNQIKTILPLWFQW